MSLVGDIKEIQAFYGTDRDGVIGPQTIRAILTDIRSRGGSQVEPEESDIDARTMEHVRSLDPKAQDRFLQFIRLAKATAATFGCDYIGIEGHRTWEEQDALYAKGRTAPGSIVTRAKGGFSNHNFGIAMDFGVFRGKSYLDDTNTELFSHVCQAEDTAAAIHALSDADLRALVGETSRNATDNNISGQMLGIALVVAAERFMKQGGKE